MLLDGLGGSRHGSCPPSGSFSLLASPLSLFIGLSSSERNLSSHTRPEEPCLLKEIADLCNPAIAAASLPLSLYDDDDDDIFQRSSQSLSRSFPPFFSERKKLLADFLVSLGSVKLRIEMKLLVFSL